MGNQKQHEAQPLGPDRPAEKRSGLDRRAGGVPGLGYLFFHGRRERIRRAADKQRFRLYDRYSPRHFAEIVAILFLSVLDALFTLYLIDHGSKELNPVMAYFIESGPFIFFTVKYALTSAAVVVFLVFKHVRIRKIGLYTASLFTYVIALFSAVVAWELCLIFLL
jgi:hypothetical protein